MTRSAMEQHLGGDASSGPTEAAADAIGIEQTKATDGPTNRQTTIGNAASAAPLIIAAPPSKSVTHRAYILAARVGGTIRAPSRCDDANATLAALQALGAQFDWIESKEACARVENPTPSQRVASATMASAEPDAQTGPNSIPVPENAADGSSVGRDIRFVPSMLRPAAVLDARSSASTLRLLSPTVARFGALWDGAADLRRRPHDGLVSALHQGGCTVEPWMRIRGPLRPGRFKVHGSSQTASGLLLAAPFLAAPTTVNWESPSHPYVALTIDVLHRFGVDVAHVGFAATIRPQAPSPTTLNVPGDWSSAAYPLAWSAIHGVPVRVDGLAPGHPDSAIIEHFRAAGCQVHIQKNTPELQSVSIVGPASGPIIADLSDCPDAFAPLCAVAATMRGQSTLSAPQLRGKESDRVDAMAAVLEAAGIEVQQQPQGLAIEGGTPKPCTVHHAGDHRIEMAASLLAPFGVKVVGPSVTRKSWPSFHHDMRAAGMQTKAQ